MTEQNSTEKVEKVSTADLVASLIPTCKAAIATAAKGLTKVRESYQACARDLLSIVEQVGSWKKGSALYGSIVAALVSDESSAKSITEGARYWARSFGTSEESTGAMLADAGFVPPAKKEKGAKGDPADLPTETLIQQAHAAINLLASREIPAEQQEKVRAMGQSLARVLARFTEAVKAA